MSSAVPNVTGMVIFMLIVKMLHVVDIVLKKVILPKIANYAKRKTPVSSNVLTARSLKKHMKVIPATILNVQHISKYRSRRRKTFHITQKTFEESFVSTM